MSTTDKMNSEVAIWARLLAPENNGLSHEAAQSFLQLTFSEQDKTRLAELAEKCNEGTLSEGERAEYEAYVTVGDVLSLLHLKAQKSLRH
jgi:hypothetical protein